MDAFPEHNPKPIIEDVKESDVDELIMWIQEKQPKILKGNDPEKLKVEGFLEPRWRCGVLRKTCSLPIRTSEMLADLAGEITGGETVSRV